MAWAWASIHVSTPDRRDRLWLVSAFAVVLLTLLGAAGEALGYDRYLKSNTTKRRTHSLFRQGSMLYELIPNMTEFMLRPLIEQFAQMLATSPCSLRCSVPSDNEGSREAVHSKVVGGFQEFTAIMPRLSPARLRGIKHFQHDRPIGALLTSRQHVRLPDAGHAVIRTKSDSGIRQKSMSGIPSTRPRRAADTDTEATWRRLQRLPHRRVHPPLALK